MPAGVPPSSPYYRLIIYIFILVFLQQQAWEVIMKSLPLSCFQTVFFREMNA